MLALDLPELAEIFQILNLLGLLFKTFVGGLTLNMPVLHLIVVCSFLRSYRLFDSFATLTVTKLAKGIHHLASHYGSVSTPFFFFPLPFSFIQQRNLAINPLRDLLSRYPYDPSFLTTIHPIFMLVRFISYNFLQSLSLSLPLDLCFNPQLSCCSACSFLSDYQLRYVDISRIAL